MNLHQVVGRTAVLLALLIVLWRGRWPERLGGSIIAAGWALTPFLERRDSWYEPQFAIMALDIAILAGLIGLSYRYGRYWAICAAAFQAVAVLTHFAFLINPHALYRAYYMGSYAIGFLILGALVGGVIFEAATPIRLRGLRSPRPPSPSPPSKA